MKSNEHVRPAGIGKSQVAFQVKGRPSLMSVDGTEIQNEISNAGTISQSNANALARAIATASASSLQQDMQNNCLEMYGVSGFFLGTGTLGANIPWIRNNRSVNSTLYDYNPNTQWISVRKQGWYLVRAYIYAPLVNAAHEWGIKLQSNIELNSGKTEVYAPWMGIEHTNKHPHASGMAFFNAPSTDENTNAVLPAFRIRLFSSASNISFPSDTTQASLQVIRLTDLEYQDRLINYPA